MSRPKSWRESLNDSAVAEELSSIDALLALQIVCDMGWMNEAMYARGAAFLARFKAGIPVHRDGLCVEPVEESR